ncbi:hypothetical protein [Edaphobacter flagellatus]|uniref:hypothetical protein n=1 Tax=Edaphobacter flagellatus TaxID=1933044 RepID=UPI0021B3623F|nr:hypothetical protein [Edaphobacter flagellatus]
MHFPQTIGLLLAVTAAMLALRAYWFRLPRRLERSILLIAIVFVTLRLVAAATQWFTISPYLDALFCWAAVISYEILLIRFSLLPPRWLTSFSAFVLLIPIFGSTLLFPLTGLFDTSPADMFSIGGNYIVERTPWDPTSTGHSGVDLVVFYKPPFAPFLRHRLQRSSFSDEECDIAAATVTRPPNTKSVRFYCPGRSGKQAAIDLVLPLR